MPCYHPLTGYYGNKVNDSGKRSLVFNATQALLPEPVFIPCGRCIGCRLDRSLSWALRCMHEASLYEDNTFLTLTYDDDHLPHGGSLCLSDIQNFMKRFRQYISPKKIRFFQCGEYGDQFARPHYHTLIFGYKFTDVVKEDVPSDTGFSLYYSPSLKSLWPLGMHKIGEVNFDSAAYVARYVLKKWAKADLVDDKLYDAMVEYSRAVRRGEAAPRGKDFFSGKKSFYDGKKEEFVTMSRRPGLGQGWFDRFSSDIYPGGFALVKGKKVKPPKFYDSQYEILSPLEYAKIKGFRVDRAMRDPDNTPYRLAIREEMKRIKLTQLQRGYENGTESLCDSRC